MSKHLESNALFISALKGDSMIYFPLNVKQEPYDAAHVAVSYEFLSSIVEYPAASSEQHLESVKKTLQETTKMNQASYLMSLRVFNDGDFYALIVPDEDKHLYDFQKVIDSFELFLESLFSKDKKH